MEVLHNSTRARVTRVSLAGRSVIRKEPLGPDADGRRQREMAMLERLRGVEGVAQLVDAPRYPESIVMEDAGDSTLDNMAKPLAADDLVGVGLGLARALASMHRKGVMHRDIAPTNIVVSREGVPCIVDFSSAAALAELRPEFTHHTEIVGTLAYVAPEQTGRTGRAVDQRADLYAFGATLYELAVGEPPFGFGQPLQLLHDHLARVAVAPMEVNPAVPEPLSGIIMHLLEKEPDDRYQSAAGAVHDLEQLRQADAHPAAAPFRIGEHDFPIRLLPPSRLVGRDAEVAALAAAFEVGLDGRCRGVLVAGAPGVGKTALVDELRGVVTAKGGWFVAGKFDQYRRDLEFDAGHQAFRALGRLLLAEPEDQLADVRGHILKAVGANAGLATAVLPEFAALLAVPPDAGDPLTAQLRVQRMAVDVLRAVASRNRPVVVFVDDLQWAGRSPLGFVDLVLSGEPIEGLLLVAAYREGDVDAVHPLAAPLSRWRRQADVRHLRLVNLPVPDLVAMVGEMLHVERGAAAELAEVISPHTGGNPHETVEILSALRSDGLLAAGAAGWRWDAVVVRAHLSRSEAAGFLASRVDAMPPTSRQMIEAMACLGGRAAVSLLQIATGEPASLVEQRLAPARDDGLLVVEPGAHEAVRFRHDRIREVIVRGVDRPRRRTLQLAMARRLAAAPQLFAVAAEQYLPVVDAVDDPAERRVVVDLLRRAADQARLIGDHASINALLTAALRLIDPNETATLIEVRTRRHEALYSLGRFDEADEEYRAIQGLCRTVTELAAATAVQVRSLTHRGCFAEAIVLGLESLRELGIAVPAADRLHVALDHQFEYLDRWLNSTDSADELARVEIADPTLLASTHLMNATLPATCFVADADLQAWLALEALRIWLEHGPGRTLLGPASYIADSAVALRGAHAASYRAAARLVSVGDARGWEPEVSQARFMFSMVACWFEPAEAALHAGQRARDGLIPGGLLAEAGYCYRGTGLYLLDCGSSLDAYLAEVDAGLAFVHRTGSEETAQSLYHYRWLVGALRSESAAAAGEAGRSDASGESPFAVLLAHYVRAITAAIFGDPVALAHHTAGAMSLLAYAPGIVINGVARMLRGLALAWQAGTADGDALDELLSELDDVIAWLAERASDAPDNFLHLLRLLEAERACAVGDARAAVVAFDAALSAVAQRQRPWHRALITDRAARFALGQGVEHVGYELLASARRQYLDWGATAKVDQLDWLYPTLRPQIDAIVGQSGDEPDGRVRDDSTVTSGTIDLLGILSASQALSSETTIERLNSRVTQVLSALTGATGVHMLLWSDDRQEWLRPAPGGGDDAVRTDGTPHAQAIPMSVVRYVERMREPLVVADAARDERFGRDPYFADVDRCSLLALPILNRGLLRGLLVLENRLIRGAFTSERLDAVKLIAGQLAVSLHNVQLYSELAASRARIVAAADQTRRRIERDLHDGAQQRLVSLAMRLNAAQASVPPELGELRVALDQAVAQASSAVEELHEIARGIHPAILAKGGLGPALKSLARRAQIPVDLTIRAPGQLPEHIEVSAYYVVAEALTNVAKHARASVATVVVESDATDAVLRIEVRDDGVGGADFTRGTGLVGLKDRVEALGGRIALHSPPGEGTSFRVELPLTAADSDLTPAPRARAT
ncbi:MAG TPA: AAA family ATPase [Baekduia sp.]|nr:AAA family ATPase [Baekduia sp.]